MEPGPSKKRGLEEGEAAVAVSGPPSADTVPTLSPGDCHILLADDEKISRLVTSKLLRLCGYEVTAVESGRELLLALAEKPRTFSLILTDVAMPDVNGLEVLRYVRSQPALHSLPVIMMSAHENAGTVFECIQRGAEDYLLKPLTQKEVKQIWQHVWRRRYSWQRVSEQKKAEAEAAAAAGGTYPPQDPTAQSAPLPLPDFPPPPPAKALSSERETADEAVELYTTAEMRQHCMRQIARYQRVLQVIDSHPHLFPDAEPEVETMQA